MLDTRCCCDVMCQAGGVMLGTWCCCDMSSRRCHMILGTVVVM